MNPTNQYFWAQALQQALNGINSSNLIGVISGVGYAVLLLSFLWAVYESFLQGGDVRGFAVALMKYGVTTLVIQHWSQVFQDAVNGFGEIASTIIQNSVNMDLTKSWTQQLQNYFSQQSGTGLTNGLQSIWNMDGAVDSEIHRHDVFERGDAITLKPTGGGGTSFAPIFTHLEDQGIQPHTVIVLTDLLGSFPHHEPGYPVIWASTRTRQAPFGSVISLEAA